MSLCESLVLHSAVSKHCLINRDLITHIFPCLRQFTCVYFEFSLAPCDFLPLFSLAVVITLGLALQHLIENRATTIFIQCAI